MIWLFAFVLWFAAGADSFCHEALVARRDVRLKKAFDENGVPRVFRVVDLDSNPSIAPEMFRIEAKLVAGVLGFHIKTISPDGERSKVLHGRVLFDAMMEFYGEHVRQIRAQWDYGINLAKFNDLVHEGETPDTAARLTWTGQQATRYGFSDLEFIVLPEGGPDYRVIIAKFSRPN